MGKRLSGSFLVLCVLCVAGYLFLTHHEKSGIQKRENLSQEKQTDAVHQGIDEKPIVADNQNRVKEEDEAATISNKEDRKWLDAAKAAINSPEPSAKFEVLWNLGKHPVSEALEILTTFLDDENFDIVSEAIDQLGSIGTQNQMLKGKVFKLLKEKALDTKFPARGQALVTAAIIGDEDQKVAAISDFISKSQDQVDMEIHATRALSFTAIPESVPLLGQILNKTENTEAKKNVLASLTAITTPEALDLLEQSLYSSNDKDQAVTAWALSMKNIDEYNQVLINAIATDKLGIKAMSDIAKSPAAADVFGEILKNDDITTGRKLECLQVLAKKSVSAPPDVQSDIISAVQPLLDSDDPVIERESIKTLGALGRKETAELIETKLVSTDPTIRQEALKAYPVHPDTYKPMLKMVWDSNEEIRRSALAMCEFLLTESDRPLLEDVASRHDDEFMRNSAKKLIDNYLMRPES